jgi:hypothetical protein
VTFRLVEAIHGDVAPFLLSRSLAHTVLHGAYANEVHFNKELLSNSGIGKRDVYQVALHEVGHVIGISHSTDERSIMYPTRIKTIGQKILPSDVDAFHVAAATDHELTRWRPSYGAPFTTVSGSCSSPSDQSASLNCVKTILRTFSVWPH